MVLTSNLYAFSLLGNGENRERSPIELNGLLFANRKKSEETKSNFDPNLEIPLFSTTCDLQVINTALCPCRC